MSAWWKKYNFIGSTINIGLMLLTFIPIYMLRHCRDTKSQTCWNPNVNLMRIGKFLKYIVYISLGVSILLEGYLIGQGLGWWKKFDAVHDNLNIYLITTNILFTIILILFVYIFQQICGKCY